MELPAAGGAGSRRRPRVRPRHAPARAAHQQRLVHPARALLRARRRSVLRADRPVGRTERLQRHHR